MLNRIFILLILTALAAAGCGQAAPAATSTVGASGPAGQAEVVDSGTESEAEQPSTRTPPAGDEASGQDQAAEPECRENDPPQTVYHVLPQPEEAEWSKGSQDAYVTLIEYGDFQ